MHADILDNLLNVKPLCTHAPLCDKHVLVFNVNGDCEIFSFM